MNDFYNVKLFHCDFDFNNRKYRVFVQLYLQLLDGTNCNVVIAKAESKATNKGNDEFCLLGIDIHKNELAPIENIYFLEIMGIILKLDIDKRIKLALKNIKLNSNGILGNFKGILKINNRLSAAIGNHETQYPKNKVTVKLLEEEAIIPVQFCFFTSNGLEHKVYIELENLKYDSYKSYHMLNGIQVYYGANLNGEYLAYNLEQNGNKVILGCEIYESRLLQEKDVQKCEFFNCNFYDTSYFLMLMSGIEEKKINLPDEYKKSYRWFAIIIPIYYLNIENEFGVGSVRFLKQDNMDIQLLKERIEKKDDARKCYAKIYVNEYNFYKAYIKGKMQINQALDFVVNLARDDSLYSNHSIDNEIIKKSTKYFNSKPTLDVWCHIENAFEKKTIIFNSELLFSNYEMSIDKNILNMLESLEKFELYLIKLADEGQNQMITPLFNALKWVRKAWDSNDLDDQIIYSIIALEFVVSGEPKSPLLSKQKKKIVKKHIEESLKITCLDLPNMESVIEEINKKFDFACSDTPFFVKLQNLIERLKIPINYDEIELIKAAREKRNAIVHGRESENLSDREIKRVCEIISLITFSKIDSLEMK